MQSRCTPVPHFGLISNVSQQFNFVGITQEFNSILRDLWTIIEFTTMLSPASSSISEKWVFEIKLVEGKKCEADDCEISRRKERGSCVPNTFKVFLGCIICSRE